MELLCEIPSTRDSFSFRSPVHFWTLFLFGFSVLLFIFVLRRARASVIPTINEYRWDFLRKRALTEYNNNERDLIAAGFTKVGVSGSKFCHSTIDLMRSFAVHSNLLLRMGHESYSLPQPPTG
jgi:hypothetical protein